jgi:DNA-binding transcriptional ArsR family regulator
MSNYDLTPDPIQALTTDEQIRAYVNPTRMTILSLLAQEKRSISGVARQMGVHPANLTHHFRLLEKAGLIALVEKRETDRNLEKYYRAKAYHFAVTAGGEPADKQLLGLSILRDNLTAAMQALKGPGEEQPVLAVLKTVRLSPEDIEKFGGKLLALAEEFGGSSSDTGTVYSLNASMYPADAGPAPAQEIKIEEGG